MKLDHEFYRLPLRFDAERLAEEVNAFPESVWKAHPQGYEGNTALSLVAVGGDAASDSVLGPMRPTEFLHQCPYIQQVMAAFNTIVGRSRLMRIAGNNEANIHVDTNYYWQERVRIHVPVITYPEVEFICGDKKVHMPAGESWLFDTWKLHNVINHDSQPRIHLVIDTVGTAAFWDLVDQARAYQEAGKGFGPEGELLEYDAYAKPKLKLESFNCPLVMSPWEQQVLLTRLLGDIAKPKDLQAQVILDLKAVLQKFQRQWRGLWACYETEQEGWSPYRELLNQLKEDLAPFTGKIFLHNNSDLKQIILQNVVHSALNPKVATFMAKGETATESSQPTTPAASKPYVPQKHPSFDRPIIIVAAPRSGSTLLFETLANSPTVWTIGGESHGVFEGIPKINPANRGFDSNRLTVEDVDPEITMSLRRTFIHKLKDRKGNALPINDKPFRMLEKTPKNALRIPFLHAIFPDAIFIYLYREPKENLSSIIEAWRSGKFVTYPKLPGWEGDPWSLLLIPGWQHLKGRGLGEIAAGQYSLTHEQIMLDLSKIPKEQWCTVSYHDFLANPQLETKRLCRFADIEWDGNLECGKLPLSKHTLTPPEPDKWKKNEDLIRPVLPLVEATAKKVEALLPSYGKGDQPVVPIEPKKPAKTETAEKPKEDKPSVVEPAMAKEIENSDQNKDLDKDLQKAPLKSVFTTNLPSFLAELGVSLLVTTYQAGKLIIVRVDDGKLNTHFRTFQMPMGLAIDRRRLVIGTKHHVWEYRNQHEVARKLEPEGKHDACFLPRSSHVTGDIRIHEIAFAHNRELWIVNTRFSCLCTLDQEHSFVPRWRPPFITGLTPEDRCHLNGLAVINDRPKYVTMLGQTDTGGGWRENKADGGLLMDVDTNEVLIDGLSMPHSPRQYRGELYVLESGDGNIARVDLKAGKVHPIAHVPGFTRGVDFYKSYAFIGLSKVRESAIFSGIPITERLQERTCGVWVVDMRNGKIVGFLRFDSGVEEIFAVQVLPNTRFPDLINEDDSVLASSFMLPKEALKEVPAGVGR